MGRRARKGNSAAISAESIKRGSVLVLLVFVLMAADRTAAQTTTGVIQGTVVEQLDGPLPGVTIFVTNTGSGDTRRTRTGAEGRFAVAGLPPGQYEVLASLDGYASQRQERLELGVGQTLVSQLALRRAPMPETLTLAGRPSMLEPRHSDVSARIESAEIEHLPLAERRVVDLAALAPGPAAGDARDRLGADGADERSVNVLVDGLDQWSLPAGPPPYLSSPPYAFTRSAVRDLLVTVSAPPTEFGRSGGAGIAIVTRSGSDIFAGQVFEYFRDTRLSSNTLANALLEQPTPSQRADQFGGAAGGPLAPGHTFFASYDGLRERHDNLIHLQHPEAGEGVFTALAPLLSTWTRTRDQHLLFARTDHRLGTGGGLSLRYHHLDLGGEGLSSSGPRRAFDSADSTDLRLRAASATVRRASGPTLVAEARALYLDSLQEARAIYPGPQAIIRETGAILLHSGPGADLPSDTRLRRLHVANTLTWATGRHTMKAGVDLEVDDWRHTTAAGRHGTYIFGSPERFDAGTPASAGDSYFQVFFGAGGEPVTTRPDRLSAALFAEDRWLMGDTLTIDAGLRLEGRRLDPPPSTNPSPELAAAGIDTGRFDMDGSAWAPRLGVAWAPSRRHVVRGAYAVVDGVVPVAMAAAAHAYNGIDVLPVTLSTAAGDPVPTYPGRLTSLPPAARPDLAFFDDEFSSARFRHASASYEWEWMPTTSVAATYFHIRGDHLPRAIDINVGERSETLFTVAGEDTAIPVGRFDPGPFQQFGRVVRFESTGVSRHDAFATELRRRTDQGWQYRITYTLGKVTATAPGTSPGFPQAPGAEDAVPLGSNLAARRTLAGTDIRHRLVLSSVLQSELLADRFDGLLERALERWRLGIIYAISSGLPYSAHVDADIDGAGSAWGDLAPGTARNEFRRPGVIRIDLRVARDVPLPGGIRLTAAADMFNVLNSRHYREVDATLYSVTGTTLVRNPRFGQELDEVLPRTVQIGVTVQF